jgi:DNA-binding NtrC family response regulator
VATGGQQRVVLVVDDEPAIRLLCRVNLELAGYEVREAGSLDEAREQLEHVDVILLDMHVGNERGEVLLKEVVQLGIAVAVVTGSTDLESASAQGANAVLAKPFTIEDLEATVAALVAERTSR